MYRGGVDHSVGVLSGTVELMCWWEENITGSGFKLAAIKRNHNDRGNKKHQKLDNLLKSSMKNISFVCQIKEAELQ